MQENVTSYPLLKVKNVVIIKDGKVLESYQGLKNVELIYEHNGETITIKI